MDGTPEYAPSLTLPMVSLLAYLPLCSSSIADLDGALTSQQMPFCVIAKHRTKA
jgi:hypothetical protein